MRWFYLSFAGPEGWRGGVFVQGHSAADAHRTVNVLGINPGGQVWMGEAAWGPPERFANRLLSKAEIDQADQAIQALDHKAP